MYPIAHHVLLMLAFCCFVLAAWQYTSPAYNRIVCIGLALGTLALLPW